MRRARRVLLDVSFVRAAIVAGDPDHEACRAELDLLVDEYEREEAVLGVHTDALAQIGADRVSDVAQVCEVVRIRGWVRRLAGRVIVANPDVVVGADRAVTLAVMSRCRFAELATADPFYAQRGVRVTPDRLISR